MDKMPLPPARDRVAPIHSRLRGEYPNVTTALDFTTPLELLVATILSAQCTDKRVNQISPPLFARFRTAADYAGCDIKELEEFIKSINFFRNKAKNIRGACAAIVERFGGEVPGNLDDLVQLPGVGRKTANVVLGNAFATPGITVDTHVGRLSRRLGLTRKRDPEKVELVLMKIVPQADWTDFCHGVILHGRTVCHARKPLCEACVLNDLCPKLGVVAQLKKNKRKRKPKEPETPVEPTAVTPSRRAS